MEDEENPSPEEQVTPGVYSVPEMASWQGKNIYDYDALVTDYSTWEELDAVTNSARRALFIITDKINKAERMALKARKEYERQYRRIYLTSTEKTQEARNMRAALKCEELENEWLKFDQMKKELERLSSILRLELQTLNTTAHNLRAQLR